MKRFISALLIIAAVILIALPIQSAVRLYSNIHNWTKVVDSTAASTRRTDSLGNNSTSGAFPIWYTNIVSDQTGGENLPTKLDGLISVYLTSVDTGDAAADVPDTSKDTVYFMAYTAWGNPFGANTNGQRTGETKICSTKVVTAGVSTSKVASVKFSIPADTALGTVVYWRIISALGDSDNSVARVAGKIYYRAAIQMFAR